MKFRTAVVVGTIGAFATAALVLRDGTPLRQEYCEATAGSFHARVDLEQAQWSSLMAATAQRRGLPVRATTIAIATAFQESKIHNIDYGDRDSIGLFQQRPSQGWGTREQILDPHYSIGKFYDALAKVDGYETMVITEAAQLVQRSAFPDAYADHEPYARALSSTLRGYSPAKFHCQVVERKGGDTREIADEVTTAFGQTSATVTDGAIEFPVGDSAENGWALAHFLVAHAARLGITRVDFAEHRWTAADSPDGWITAPTSTQMVAISVR